MSHRMDLLRAIDAVRSGLSVACVEQMDAAQAMQLPRLDATKYLTQTKRDAK